MYVCVMYVVLSIRTISGGKANEYDQMTCQVDDNKAETLQITVSYLDDKKLTAKNTIFADIKNV